MKSLVMCYPFNNSNTSEWRRERLDDFSLTYDNRGWFSVVWIEGHENVDIDALLAEVAARNTGTHKGQQSMLKEFQTIRIDGVDATVVLVHNDHAYEIEFHDDRERRVVTLEFDPYRKLDR